MKWINIEVKDVNRRIKYPLKGGSNSRDPRNKTKPYPLPILPNNYDYKTVTIGRNLHHLPWVEESDFDQIERPSTYDNSSNKRKIEDENNYDQNITTKFQKNNDEAYDDEFF